MTLNAWEETVYAALDQCPQCGGPVAGAAHLCLSCGGAVGAALEWGDAVSSRADERPRFQNFVGWFLLLLGAAGLSYGGWRFLDAMAGPHPASPAAVATSDGAGVLWAVVLFFLLPGVVFAYAGVALLKRQSVDRNS